VKLDFFHWVLLHFVTVVQQEASVNLPPEFRECVRKAHSAQLDQHLAPYVFLGRFLTKIRATVLSVLLVCIVYNSNCHNFVLRALILRVVRAIAPLALQVHFLQTAQFRALCAMQGRIAHLCVFLVRRLLKPVLLAIFHFPAPVNAHRVQMVHIPCRIQVPALHVLLVILALTRRIRRSVFLAHIPLVRPHIVLTVGQDRSVMQLGHFSACHAQVDIFVP